MNAATKPSTNNGAGGTCIFKKKKNESIESFQNQKFASVACWRLSKTDGPEIKREVLVLKKKRERETRKSEGHTCIIFWMSVVFILVWKIFF